MSNQKFRTARTALDHAITRLTLGFRSKRSQKKIYSRAASLYSPSCLGADMHTPPALSCLYILHLQRSVKSATQLAQM